MRQTANNFNNFMAVQMAQACLFDLMLLSVRSGFK